jgi:hypothetical protein
MENLVKFTPNDVKLLMEYSKGLVDVYDGWDYTRKNGHHLADACSRGSTRFGTNIVPSNWLSSDIKRLLVLMPWGVHADFMKKHNRSRITPLYLACENPQIGFDVIQAMVEAGADIHRAVKRDGKFVPLVPDILELENNAANIVRLMEIQKYFDTLGTPQKYTHYNREFADFYTDGYFAKIYFPKGHQLLDACECKTLKFSDTTLDDIKKIVELVPESVKCNLGERRYRSRITALYFACENENIPLEIIKFLVEKGADPNRAIMLNNGWVSIADDIMKYSGRPYNKERMAQIKEYLDSLGSMPEEDRFVNHEIPQPTLCGPFDFSSDKPSSSTP